MGTLLFLFLVMFTVQDNCGCDKPLPEVLSSVNGVKITAKDFDPATESRISELKRQVIDARQRELDLQINSTLLQAEAKKRNVPTKKILEDEVIAKAKEPTEEEARKFFDDEKARIKGSSAEFGEVKNQIMEHLRAIRRQELAKAFADRLRTAAGVKVLVESITPPATDADRQRVFAVVNGKQITSDDIEKSLESLIYGVQQEMYDLQRRDLDRKIHNALISQEAQKRQITSRALLDEVKSKAAPVTEGKAKTFYDTNREKMNGEFAALKDQIIWYLQNAEADKLQLTFAEGLRKTAAVQDFLTPPERKGTALNKAK
jgi:hypothetical protein